MLTPQESESLFATLAQLVADGLSVIFISHKLDEVLRVSDRIAVLRAGRLVATLPRRRGRQGDARRADGRPRGGARAAPSAARPARVVCELRGATLAGASAPRPCSMA